MPTFEIICLANSIKHGGRCIAGLKTDSTGWLRPISAKRDGTLYEEHYTLADGEEPQLFDVIKLECTQPYLSCHQPENWIINDRRPWQRSGTPDLTLLRRIINPEVVKHKGATTLLGSADHRVAYTQLKTNAIAASLALIKPTSLSWQVLGSGNTGKKIKASFQLGDIAYELPVTDPIWRKRLADFEMGQYTSLEVIETLELTDFEPDRFLLTVSLGEPFDDDFCYKLVAAVINTTAIKKRLNIQ